MCGACFSGLSSLSSSARFHSAISARISIMASQKRSSSACTRLGWFDHQGTGHRPRHGRGMEAIVHQPLGHILHAESGAFEGAQVENALVGHIAARAGVEHGEVRLQALGHVVGVENGNRRSPGSAPRRPSWRCTSRRSAGCRRCPREQTRPRLRVAPAAGFTPSTTLCPGRKGTRWAFTPMGPMPGTTTAVGNAEGLVQIQVADIGSESAGRQRPTWAFMLAPSI